MELSRLVKTSNIVKSNHQPHTTMPLLMKIDPSYSCEATNVCLSLSVVTGATDGIGKAYAEEVRIT